MVVDVAMERIICFSGNSYCNNIQTDMGGKNQIYILGLKVSESRKGVEDIFALHTQLSGFDSQYCTK